MGTGQIMKTREEEKDEYITVALDLYWEVFHWMFQNDAQNKWSGHNNIRISMNIDDIVETSEVMWRLERRGYSFARGKYLFADSFWIQRICSERYSFFPRHNPNYKQAKKLFKGELARYGYGFKYFHTKQTIGWKLVELPKKESL